MRYRALFLDFYGTLVAEDDEIIASICTRVAKRIGDLAQAKEFGRRWYQLFSERCLCAYGSNFRRQRDIELETLTASLSEFSAALDPAALSQELFAYWAQPAAFPDSHSFLSLCTVPMCIVSNIDTNDIVSASSRHGWKFPHVVTSEMARSYKPRPEIFEAALDRLQLDPQSVLHVGDSLSSDVCGAANLGIDSAWINRTGRHLPEKQPAPTLEFANLTELANWIDTSA